MKIQIFLFLLICVAISACKVYYIDNPSSYAGFWEIERIKFKNDSNLSPCKDTIYIECGLLLGMSEKSFKFSNTEGGVSGHIEDSVLVFNYSKYQYKIVNNNFQYQLILKDEEDNLLFFGRERVPKDFGGSYPEYVFRLSR